MSKTMDEEKDDAAHLITAPEDLIEVGVVGEPYGIKGWVKAYPYARQEKGQRRGGDALLAAKTWWLSQPAKPSSAQLMQKASLATCNPSTVRAYQVIQTRIQGSAVVAQLAGITERDSAQALRGQCIEVTRSSFPALSEGEYYWADLLGLDVLSLTGQSLGQVAGLLDNGAHAVLRVAFSATSPAGQVTVRERMIPFVDAYVHQVDLSTRQVIVDWHPDWDLTA
jgi:16S rRNA processing protein RimM